MNINYYQRSKLGVWSKTQRSTLIHERFITAKISGNALEQESRTNSMLRHCSLQSDTGTLPGFKVWRGKIHF